MNSAARSILVYSVYLLGQGVVLLAVPNVALRIFGLPETSEVWVRIVGMTVLFFSIYYAVAARHVALPITMNCPHCGSRGSLLPTLLELRSWPAHRSGSRTATNLSQWRRWSSRAR